MSVPVASSDSTEASVSPSALTFTGENWQTPQSVEIVGEDDGEQDGDQTFHVTFGPTASADDAFDGLVATSDALTNTDDEAAGFRFSAPTGPTTEAGASASFTVWLRRAPTANVVATFGSLNTAEGVVPSTVLTFTADNWNAPQTVTVTGVDDAAMDGPQSFDVAVTSVVTTDPAYAAVTLPAGVSLVNLDDETAGVVVTAASPLVTTESSGIATFTVVLSAAPSANVTLRLASNAPDEGLVVPSTLVFTPESFDSPRTVMLIGQNDDLEDGAQPYLVVFQEPESADPAYAVLPAPASLAATNTDNDSAGISVLSVSAETSESGGAGSFAVVLNAPPTADVTLTLDSSQHAEGTVNPTSLTFTPLSWDAPQVVTVTGANDAVADGNQPYSIVFDPPTSTDPDYDALDAPPSITFTNFDDDSAGIVIVGNASLVTTELGGTATFSVALRSRPSADVTLTYVSSKPGEGLPGPTSLVFTNANWNAPQSIVVTGQNDASADGAQLYTISFASPTSADATYAALPPFSGPMITNTDDDTAGITVTAAPMLTTTEEGGTAMFSIVLTSKPTGNVAIGCTSSAPDEGTPAPANVLFTPDDWNTPHVVTITGVNDDVADGNQPYTIALGTPSSSDTAYASLPPRAPVPVTNADDDAAGITVTAAPSLTTTEAGGTATFTVVLKSQPTASVSLTAASTVPSEGIVSPATLTFLPGNWNVAQTVTVTGQNDDSHDGNQPYAVTFGLPSSADPKYAALPKPVNVPVSNTDDDTPAIVVTLGPTNKTTESGHTATFTIVLASRPTNDVSLAYASTATAEGTVSPGSVTFTPAQWNVPKTVTITGQNDAIADGDQSYQILFMAPTSMDPDYASRPAPMPLSMSNVDNDVAAPGITLGPNVRITPTSQTTVSFGGYLNGESFQQEGILTFNGYQYAAYWDANQHVMLSRRPLGGTWVNIELDPEYVGTSNDAHNVIVLGITPTDGRLHVVFDHHSSNLHYNFSVPGLVTNPESAVWATSSFQPTFTSVLGGDFVAGVTYPRFVNTPSGKLLLEFRFGTSGNGDQLMYEYDGTTSTWTSLGGYISGVAENVNPYVHGIEYSGTRLHLAWCYRASPNATTNFGLAYAYSDDDGRTWKNNAGVQIGVTGTTLMSMNSPGVFVWTIPQNRGYINQEHMTVDQAGRVHVLVSHMPDAQADDSNFGSARTKSQFFHYWRDTSGLWRRNATGIPVIDSFRGKLAVSPTGNLYAVLPSVRIAAASASALWTNWTVIDTTYAGYYFSDPLIDRSLLRLGSTLVVFAPTVNTGAVAIDTMSFTLQ